ncbi:UNVERIFIED_CONTAM: hypothetical protein K2H54_016693 [Gekko kuhli]
MVSDIKRMDPGGKRLASLFNIWLMVGYVPKAVKQCRSILIPKDIEQLKDLEKLEKLWSKVDGIVEDIPEIGQLREDDVGKEEETLKDLRDYRDECVESKKQLKSITENDSTTGDPNKAEEPMTSHAATA